MKIKLFKKRLKTELNFIDGNYVLSIKNEGYLLAEITMKRKHDIRKFLDMYDLKLDLDLSFKC